MTSLSDIPNIPDNTVLPFLKGTLDKVYDVTSGKNKAGKAWKKQGFMLSSPSGKVMVDTFIQSLFVTPDMIGQELHYYSSKTPTGFSGIVKSSYKTKCPPDDDPATFVPETRHRVSLDYGTKIKAPDDPVPAVEDAEKRDADFIQAVKTIFYATEPGEPQKPMTQPPAAKERPPMSPDLLKLARQWQLACFAANEVCPADFSPELVKDVATTLFIEGQRKGIQFSATPGAGSKPAHPKPDPEKPAPKPAAPKLTKEQIATKIIGEMPVTKADFEGADLIAIFDLCYADAKHELPVEFLDATFDAVKKKCGNEKDVYPEILANWPRFMAGARKRKAEKEAEIDVVDV